MQRWIVCSLLLFALIGGATGAAVRHTRNMNEGAQLASAASRGDVRTLRRLLDQDYDPNPTGKASNPLYWAALKGQDEALRLLLERGADARSEGGSRALCAAAHYGHLGAVRLLLSYGADPIRPGPMGLTPLEEALRENEWLTTADEQRQKREIVALRRQKREIVALLRRAGARP